MKPIIGGDESHCNAARLSFDLGARGEISFSSVMPSPAPACRKALEDATLRWPNRNRASDGIMGDARHQARKSDHNLGNAFDITHDPAVGCHGDVIAAHALTDDRVKYVIWNRRIHSRDSRGWRRYTGKNPHTHHCHVSIHASARGVVTAWGWRSGAAPPDTSPDPEPPAQPGTRTYPGALRVGMKNGDVRAMQERLRALGWTVEADGDFGPQTRWVVVRFQRRHGLDDDGIVGRKTWSKLWE